MHSCTVDPHVCPTCACTVDPHVCPMHVPAAYPRGMLPAGHHVQAYVLDPDLVCPEGREVGAHVAEAILDAVLQPEVSAPVYVG